MDPFLASPFFHWQGNTAQGQVPEGDKSSELAPQQNHPMGMSLNHQLNGLALLAASPSMHPLTSATQVQFWNGGGQLPSFADGSSHMHQAQIPQLPNNYFAIQPMVSFPDPFSGPSYTSSSPERTPPSAHLTHPTAPRQRRRRRHNLVPLTQEDLSKLDSAAQKRAIKAERKRMRERNRDLVCHECGSTSTPLWRRSAVDPERMLCNACGLHEKNNLKAQANESVETKDSSPLNVRDTNLRSSILPSSSSPLEMLPNQIQHTTNVTQTTQEQRKNVSEYQTVESTSNTMGLLHPNLLYPTTFTVQLPQQVEQPKGTPSLIERQRLMHQRRLMAQQHQQANPSGSGSIFDEYVWSGIMNAKN
ncbi:hypothetical protein BCR33DRAFT_761416 [Rhizoclosmatium globosum]|uniref:GATA-type domain-containing protein n=1 Tax=Rhizoclosmatium globosum TaxID=329046 RepID=A0A1Y2D3L7_9FUNG|nr:hypothetical protein BCR33DRAFT_761416 [Rhizoclosmatium globosum]|eukprot:ORY53155.1 hypothetical protein BCR33DRAFT_761416 [Rhizoclosmatium globosum]